MLKCLNHAPSFWHRHLPWVTAGESIFSFLGVAHLPEEIVRVIETHTGVKHTGVTLKTLN